MSGNSDNRGDARISGAGTIPGGTYGTISISGAGTVEGDVDAKSVSISGSGRINGKVKSEELRTSGSSHVSGDIEVHFLEISGSCRIEGSARSEKVHASGTLQVGGNLSSDTIKTSGSFTVGAELKARDVNTSGSLEVGGDVEVVEVFKMRGQFKVGGILKAGRISIEPTGQCSSNEIRSADIKIKQNESPISALMLKILTFGKLSEVYADLIEGDDIDIEATKAKLVRGARVKIGKGCSIEMVKYSERVDIDKDADVLSLSGPPMD